MRKFVLSIFILIWFSATPIHALNQFSTDYNVTYTIQPTGNTHVSLDISQRNNLSTVYATSFSLSLSQTKIQNIKVRDSLGTIIPELKISDNLTNISFDFNHRVVGKDKINNFTVEYDTPDIATRQGSVWEINIPKLETDENANNQTVLLVVPDNFPIPTYLEPKPAKTLDNSKFYFNAANLGNKSISAIFGSSSYYRVKLRYQLANPLKQTLNTQVALPPDTSYQQVFIENIQPKPLDIQVDVDGNWLASYSVLSSSQLEITASFIIKVSFNPRTWLLSVSNLYTKATRVWDFTDPSFFQISTQINTPKSIYDYVTSHLNYNYSKVTARDPNFRPGATFALSNPNQAICTEFSDLFIALARRASIPSRELQGYALSSNDKLKPISLTQDILHSWPEYYDTNKQTWIQVDPTWAQTTNGVDYFNKLDLNHLVFAIHGQSPTQPLPAGAYKTISSNSKNISVESINPINFPKAKIIVDKPIQKENRLIFQMKNEGNVAYRGDVNIPSTPYTFQKDETVYILPGSSISQEIEIRKKPILKTTDINLIISLDGQSSTQVITLKPYLNQIIAISLVGLCLGSCTLIAWYIHFRRRKQKSPLHW